MKRSSRGPGPHISLSPDLNTFAVTGVPRLGLCIYSVSTGKRLTSIATNGLMPWFTPDGCEVWCRHSGNFEPVGGWPVFEPVEGWTIAEDTESGLTKLELLGPTARPLGGSIT